MSLQLLQLAVWMAGVFLFDARHVNHAPHPLLSLLKADQKRQKLLHIQAIALGLASSAIQLDARGVHYPVFHSLLGQIAVQPETVSPGLVATDHPTLRRKTEATARQIDLPQ